MMRIPARWREATWPALVSVLLFLALLLVSRGRADSQRLTELIHRCQAAKQNLEDGYAAAYGAELALVGRRLRLPRLESLSGASGKSTLTQGLRLLLLVSDISCNVCQDRETQFTRSVAERFGAEAVMVIIAAKERRFVSTYARANGGHFPVYLAPPEGIAPDLPAPPLLMLLDGNRILVVHQPHPGYERFSEAFHLAIDRMLGDSRVGDRAQ